MAGILRIIVPVMSHLAISISNLDLRPPPTHRSMFTEHLLCVCCKHLMSIATGRYKGRGKAHSFILGKPTGHANKAEDTTT